jgi:heme exporter protein A
MEHALRTHSFPSTVDAVAAHGVARRFGGKWALRGVTESVKQGEVLAIKGSNGSGKSTLLRIIATALRLTRGECQAFDHDVTRTIESAIAAVGLPRVASERARNLSSGMQRRVAIARLMTRAPRLLLLDEPQNTSTMKERSSWTSSCAPRVLRAAARLRD